MAIVVISNPSSLEDLENQYSEFLRLSTKFRKLSNGYAMGLTGKTNQELYAEYRCKFNKEDKVEISPNDVKYDTDQLYDGDVDMIGESTKKPKKYDGSITLEKALEDGGYYDQYGTWNSILKLDSDPDSIYRGRVEALILRDNSVYLAKNANGYRLPGGSFEKDIPNEIQVQNECKEEARIIIKNVLDTQLSYTENFSKPPKWAIEQKLPVLWTGKYTKVYVAEYGKMYRGFIDYRDRDDNMYVNGRFYDLDEVYDILSPIHKQAIDMYKKTPIKEEADFDGDVDLEAVANGVTQSQIDMAKEWMDRYGFYIIHSRLDLDELEREFIGFKGMPEYARKVSNKRCREIYGVSNITLYKAFKSKLLVDDKPEINTDVIDRNSISSSDLASNVSESTYRSILQINEAIYNNDLLLASSMIKELSESSFETLCEEVVVNNIMSDLMDKIDNVNNMSYDILPFYTPNEMDMLGVCEEDPTNNYYGVSSESKDTKDWYDKYKVTGDPGEDWFERVSKVYKEYLLDKSDKNRQKLLEYGWCPEVKLTIPNIKKRTECTRKKLKESYGITIEDATDKFDIDSFIEIPYTNNNIRRYNLESYLTDKNVDIMSTKGILYVNENNEYICHVSIGEDGIIVGSGYKPGYKKVLEQLI